MDEAVVYAPSPDWPQIERLRAENARLREKLSLCIKTIEMLGKDRSSLEDSLEQALNENARLREALTRIYDDAECNCHLIASVALEKKEEQ